MTMEQIDFFLMTVRCDTFLEAAENLHIAQSTLSKQIQKLESELNLTLFDRTRRQAVLTPAGKLFCQEASELSRQYHQMLQKMRHFKESERQPLRVGSLPFLTQYHLTSRIRAFAHTHPEVELMLEECEENELMDGLQSGRFDLVIARDSMFTSNFTVLLIARILPAFLHPVYVSMAFTVAAASVSKEQAPKAVSKVFVGVSAGMVLGVPVTSFIASEVSFSMAMLFFTVVNALVFVATILFIPSMPVKEKVSYGAQLSVLKKTTMWYSIIAVTLINGAMFGFFSYMSDYLKKVTEVPYNVISAVLLVYGLANIVGNVMAGKLLSINAKRSIILMPFVLLVSYICLFIVGEWIGAMVIVILILGVLAGIASNNMQYMITDAAPEAPDFANGMFLTSANLGTTIGTAICGAFITEMGTRYSVFGSLLFLIASIVFVYLRVRVAHIRKQANINIVTE